LKVEYPKKFLKDLARIPSQTRVHIEHFVFEELPSLDSINQVGKIEQMKGYSEYFKIRFGNYRIGLKLEADKVILKRVLHRKEIYRYFP